MKKIVLNIIEIILVLIIALVCIVSIYESQVSNEHVYSFALMNTISNVIKNKVGFITCILLPFSLLFVLETIKINKETKRKELENTMKLQLEELKNIDNKSDLSKAIEDTIKTQIKEIQSAKRDFKKIEELEQTIQIPLEEIQKQINELNKKLSKTKEEDKIEDDTVVLFTDDDIKEVIKKELESTKIVNKKKKNIKKSTDTVDKNKTKSKISTVSVENLEINQ